MCPRGHLSQGKEEGLTILAEVRGVQSSGLGHSRAWPPGTSNATVKGQCCCFWRWTSFPGGHTPEQAFLKCLTKKRCSVHAPTAHEAPRACQMPPAGSPAGGPPCASYLCHAAFPGLPSAVLLGPGPVEDWRGPGPAGCCAPSAQGVLALRCAGQEEGLLQSLLHTQPPGSSWPQAGLE